MTIFSKINDQYGGFDVLIDEISPEKLEGFSDNLYKKFCAYFASANYMTNVMWMIRNYSCAKKVLLSAMFTTQAEHLEGLAMKNLKFYASYYALFNALSSNIVLHPNINFDIKKPISHKQIFSDIRNFYINFGIYDRNILDLVSEARFAREQYSYHLPLGGTEFNEGDKLDAEIIYSKLKSVLPKILQISSLQSFLAFFAWERKVGKPVDEYVKHQSDVDNLFFSIVEKSDHLKMHTILDRLDYQSLGYMLAKIGHPWPVGWFIEGKMLDDFEAGWTTDDKRSDAGYDINDISSYLARTINL
jgi:hypothetical protein